MNQEGREDRDYWNDKYGEDDECVECGSDLTEWENEYCVWCSPEEDDDE